MNKVAIIRWILFLVIGLPFQLVVFLVYPFFYLLARLLWQKSYKPCDKKFYDHYILPERDSRQPIIDREKSIFLNHDNHNLFTQYPICEPRSFQYFVEYVNGYAFFTRKMNAFADDMRNVSGDCIISFCFAAVMRKNYQDPAVRKLILDLAKSYMIYLGTLSWDKVNDGHVSSRCNNFGINWCPDGWMSLGQPMFGPNFWTTSALLALAAYHSIWWRLIFWVHWWVLGGWYWAFMPAIYPKDGLWYVRDMIMKALYVHLVVFGARWWILKPMQITNETVPYFNLLFEAILGKKTFVFKNIQRVAPVVTRWWSQNKYGASLNDDDIFMSHIHNVLLHIVSISQKIIRSRTIF